MMRLLLTISLVLLFGIVAAAQPPAQAAPIAPGATPPRVNSRLRSAIPVVIPPNDIRRVSFPDVAAGASLAVSFEVLPPGGTLVMEILRKDSDSQRGAEYSSVVAYPAASQMSARQRLSLAGHYVVVLRQPPSARAPVKALVSANVAALTVGEPAVRTLSTEKRVAVAVFSMGFLWTTLLICGAPIIRAFRSRRTRETPPWYA